MDIALEFNPYSRPPTENHAGFPFDDLPSRTNVRSYLDDLASRHPEFADQLKEPPWSEDFVDSSFRRTSNLGKSGSGSSGNDHERGPFPARDPQQARHQNLNNFGLRNTVPLGQSPNPEEQRRPRSMSAPPENRNSDKPKRYVSKCEIPINQEPEEKAPGYSKVPSEQGQGKPSNVRLIPIQVEGRDEPIINADVEMGANYDKMQFPFEARLPRDFGSYQNHSPRFAQRERTPTPTSQQQQQYQPQQQQQPPQPQQHQQQQQQQHHHQGKTQSQPQGEPVSQPIPMPMPTSMPMPMSQPAPPQADEVDSKTAEPAKADPAKDPLAKVGLIQKEVDQLKQEVEAFNGKSRVDKQFMILDELLTRKLISLDDIDTEGKEDVRQARKDTIRSIQRCISLLESRVPKDAKDSNIDNSDSTALVPVGYAAGNAGKDENSDSKGTAHEAKGKGSG